MTKLPWMKFFPGDWLKDPQLRMCSPSTRGVWIDLICAMDISSRSGKIIGTPDQLARVCGCPPGDILEAVKELKETKTANVTFCNGTVTVINRRMFAEAKRRESDRLRQRRHRGHEDVTDLSEREVRSQKSEPPIGPPSNKTETPQKRPPPGFVVTDNLKEWAKREVPGVDIEFETEIFRDKEFYRAHKDWDATWRNWMRDEYKKLCKSQETETESLYPEVPRSRFK